MKLLHIIQKIVHGGAQRTLYNLVRNMPYFEHYILTYMINDEYKDMFAKIENAKLCLISSLLDYKKAIVQLDYDIVHYHWWPGLDVFGYYFSKKGIPVVLTLQEQCPPPIYDFYYVAGSQSNIKYLEEIPANRKEVIHLGIDTNYIAPKVNGNVQNKEFVIGRVSTIIEKKMPKDLFKVFSDIKVDNKKLKFLVCGTGDDNIIQFLNKEKRKFPDCNIVIDNDSNVSEKYRNMDCFLYWLPEGESESFGLVIVEAMAAGIPVVAQNKGALNEILQHGVNGFLFERMDDINFYINQIVHDYELRDKIIANAKRTVMQLFTAEAMSEKYRKLYEKLVGKESLSGVK